TMTTAVMEAERTVKTGNVILDMEIPLLSDEQLEKLADYAKYLRWSAENDDDDDWADAPLTPEEEAQLEESIRDFENGEYLTLDEFMKGL
ncbi:MAG: hypothetical protein IJU07_03505, partial [Synergistaceae bacterium]|nr:hypothetical protein [Synergistaceae bacterium]